MSWLLTPIVHECALQSMLLLCGQCIVCMSLIHRFLDGIASSVGWCPLHRLSVAINCSLMIIALFDGGFCIICWWPVHGSLVAIASFVGRHCIVGWWSLLCLLVDYWNIGILTLAGSSGRLCSASLGVYCIVLWLPLHQRFWC